LHFFYNNIAADLSTLKCAFFIGIPKCYPFVDGHEIGWESVLVFFFYIHGRSRQDVFPVQALQSGGSGEILGCFQFSSPAWKMAPRDRWIGWSDAERKANLQKIINNSRFLILPWVQVKNLASTALSLAVKTVAGDWESCYGYRPVLMETLVDRKRFKGTCYKAANWIHVGETTGRGRMDRDHSRDGAVVKEIYVYPLSSRFRQELAGC